MAKLSTEEFISAIKEMSVLELNELVKAIEAEFGVFRIVIGYGVLQYQTVCFIPVILKQHVFLISIRLHYLTVLLLNMREKALISLTLYLNLSVLPH